MDAPRRGEDGGGYGDEGPGGAGGARRRRAATLILARLVGHAAVLWRILRAAGAVAALPRRHRPARLADRADPGRVRGGVGARAAAGGHRRRSVRLAAGPDGGRGGADRRRGGRPAPGKPGAARHPPIVADGWVRRVHYGWHRPRDPSADHAVPRYAILA